MLKTDNVHAISALRTAVRSSTMELQKELEEESNKARHQFYCSPDSMSSGGQNLRNVMVIYAMSQDLSSGGKTPLERRLE